MEWIEDEDSPCNTVYGYVPVKVVNQLIEKHGAYDKEKTEQAIKNYEATVALRIASGDIT